MKVKFTVICGHGDGRRDLLLPGKYEVCPRCEGKGKHTNPAIDGDGLTQEDFDENPGFFEAYMSGLYDISCEECGGERVKPQLALDRLPKMLRKRVEDTLEIVEMDRREAAHYRRLSAMGIEY